MGILTLYILKRILHLKTIFYECFLTLRPKKMNLFLYHGCQRKKQHYEKSTCNSAGNNGTVPHRRIYFFYSDTNHFIQLEDTTIKTERGCSIQRTEQTTVVHHSSLGLHCCGCPDQISCAAGFISRTQRGSGQ